MSLDDLYGSQEERWPYDDDRDDDRDEDERYDWRNWADEMED